MTTQQEIPVSAVIAIQVENESGALARVIGLFSGRGYNIESLTVAPVDETRHQSRINIVTTATPRVLEQIRAQVERLVPVYRVSVMTKQDAHVAREMALVKVIASGERRADALRIAQAFRAHPVDASA
ncbi:acetolactate synthase small subunit, partial [Novacetimonas hansenii]